ncbi:Sirohydrochlorin cobaltochelatase CbiKP [Porphyromonas levii]|nr:Sirohydrochlorin cobaltochelatase CbiKP [Porphyromonas levii]MBR8715174.1 Sirohydrochlorin cobaltochelatase CbiKP [Porphyromonas levii]MBR8727635.1 Sirohydrochlorin cobaltochelatase CbiKP [Porphyromonas levii]MBR8736012.1 Sirohydrochlorin cobaltochelatase CbiKP [Porphyromonas levii]MBR8778066.1 Sirohydrochlorin cobaltochelatase CbiKP [Porphyromonas levii]
MIYDMKKFVTTLVALATITFVAGTTLTSCKGTDNPAEKTSTNPADAFPKKHDTAVLLVTFGSTFEVPEKTFDNQKKFFGNAFPNTDLFISYTSRTIINRLQAQGKEFIPPAKWMESFRGKDYKNVYVQSLHVIPGEEFTLLDRAYVHKEYNVYLEDDRRGRNNAVLGKPLLYSKEDIERVAKILVDDHKEAIKKDEVVAFMGHGNPEELHRAANQRYIDIEKAMREYAKKEYGHDHIYVATVDFPDRLFTYLSAELKKIEGTIPAKKIHLQPLMTIVGDHANNDMAGDYDKDARDDEQSWKVQLEKKGWTVKAHMRGLGDYKEINDIYLEHLKEAIAELSKK